MTTPRLGAPELVVSQDVPETTVNEQIRFVEQGANRFIVLDKDLATPPGSPSDGDAYIVAGSPTGAWTGWANRIAFYMSGWQDIVPIEGTRAYVQDENTEYEYNGSAWGAPSTSGYAPGGTDVALADGGTGASLSDPNADRIMFWDDSAGQVTWLTAGSGLSISGTTITASGGGGGVDVEEDGVSEGTGITTLNFSTGLDVSVTGSEATITASGGGGGGSELPFTPPTTSTHATNRQTAASFTASATDTSAGLTLSLEPTGAGNKTIARLKTPPSAPFQIDIRFRQTRNNTAGEAGLILHNSSNGRNLRLLHLQDGAIYSQAWSNLETFNSSIGSFTGIPADYHMWFRVTVDGSGNVAFFFSLDGGFFKAVGTTTLATYLTAGGGSLDEVGVFARASGTGTSGATFHNYDES